jgi:maleylacetoacetate isomerase
MDPAPTHGRLSDYWRSTASYRVRICLNLKGIAAEQVFVHLRKGEQRQPAHLARNPAGLVPVWQDKHGTLTQSLAIIAYLDEVYPDPPLLPGNPWQRALIHEMALMVAADIHPIGNLRVLEQLSSVFVASAEQRAEWQRHWIGLGFAAVEARLRQTAGCFAIGDQVTLADLCLVPQLYNARRFALDLAPFPTLLRVEAACHAIPAFEKARPENQPDAEQGS